MSRRLHLTVLRSGKDIGTVHPSTQAVEYWLQMLTRELEETLSYAVDQAVSRRHEYVTLEHLLYALLEDSSARDILFNCGADLQEVARALEEYFDNVL